MPTIINDSKQLEALAEIEENLAAISTINSIMASSANSDFFIATSQNNKTKLQLDCRSPEAKKLQSTLTGYRQRLAKNINVKAARHNIQLSESDKASMDLLPVDNSEGESAENCTHTEIEKEEDAEAASDDSESLSHPPESTHNSWPN